MWRKSLSIAILGCWSMAAWAAGPWCGVSPAPVFTFEWLPKGGSEAAAGSVRIKDASGKIVQVLDGLENYYQNSESLDTSRDFNNDGCPDLVVTNSVAGIGNESLTVFLYDARTKRFALNETLSDIGGLDLDPKDRNCVTSFWKGGAADVYTAHYCWSGGKLRIKSEHEVSPVYDGIGGLRCYRHVDTDYRNGRKHRRSDCSKRF